MSVPWTGLLLQKVNFAQIASRLHSLIRKGTLCLDRRMLHFTLVEAPVLVYPNFEDPFTLETDKSGNQLGATLFQDRRMKGYTQLRITVALCPPRKKEYDHRTGDAGSGVGHNHLLYLKSPKHQQLIFLLLIHHSIHILLQAYDQLAYKDMQMDKIAVCFSVKL